MNRFFPPALSRYLALSYTAAFAGCLAGLLGVVYLFDTVELLRRASKFPDVPTALVLQMGILKLPEMAQIILPFAVLFSGMMVFWHLTRRHELVAVRAAGLSAWQFLGPVAGVALLIGVIQMTLLNPMGAVLLSKFESLESRYLDRRESLISLSAQGLWLRQAREEGGSVILHGAGVRLPEWALEDVMVLFFDSAGAFEKRIDAPAAHLETGRWILAESVVNAPGKPPEKTGLVTIDTALTAGDIEESFASPATVPFWRLPSFMATMRQTGFDPTRLEIHFQGLLAQPLMLVSMILLAAAVSLRQPRQKGTAILIGAGVLIGFAVFFMASFLQALGASGQIPVIPAAWAPAMISFLCGVGAILTLEDG